MATSTRKTPVANLIQGDRLVYANVIVTILSPPEPATPDGGPYDLFGRRTHIRLMARREDTGTEGWILFGPQAEADRIVCNVAGCTGHPSMPKGWTSWQETLHSDLSSEALDTWKTSEPVARAASLGHDVEPLDTALPDDAQWRWICRSCRDVVLIYGTNIYGAAVEYDCAGGA